MLAPEAPATVIMVCAAVEAAEPPAPDPVRATAIELADAAATGITHPTPG
jgi:hypothetical protein